MRAVLRAVQVSLWVGLASGASAMAAPKSLTLPADGMQLELSELPGFLKARASCMTCHSAEYIRYQPPAAPRAYWEAMVKRMKAVFNAPIDDADMPEIVDYLVRTYGAERAQAAAPRQPEEVSRSAPR